MWSAIERNCRTIYGYGHLNDVEKGGVDNRAESFFFAETLKYAYLLMKDEKIVDFTKQLFNTEAHPLHIYAFLVCWTSVLPPSNYDLRQVFNI